MSKTKTKRTADAAAVAVGTDGDESRAIESARTEAQIDELKCADVIRTLKPSGIADKFEMGDALRQVEAAKSRERCGFTRWLNETFNMSRAAATSLMRISRAVAPVDRQVVAQKFDMGALYELTRTVQGADALATAIKRAWCGDHITARVAKELLHQHARAGREASIVVLPDSMRVECCDIRELDIAEGSVDMILTDPPYDEASVPLYGQVAELGARILRPGGWCLAYTGKMYLARIHYRMKKHLSYSFQFDVPHAKSTLIKSLHIEQNSKCILGYRHEPGKPWWPPISDRVTGAVAKGLHKWQQPIEEAEQLIGGLCPEGGVVCDPMCGSGTTLAAALKLGRQIIGADIDADSVRITQQRLAGVLADIGSAEPAA